MYIERIVFIDETIASNKSLVFDHYEREDVYLPSDAASEELNNVLDSLLNIKANNWKISNKRHVIYKVSLNKNFRIVVSEQPIKAIDKYFFGR